MRAGYLLVAVGGGEGLSATDAELDTYYKAHPAEFTQPERRRALAAILPAASVPAPAVTDADIEAAYKARRSQFEQPARTKVSHVLIKVPAVGGSAAEDQAKARAETTLARIRGGADFAQVARETSEDPSTASRGGDLGLIAAGELVPEVDKAIQSLKPGELGGPVRSPFGYHILKVFEVVPGSRKELKEVAPTLRATLAAEGQLKAHRDRAQEAQRALLVAADFAVEARRLGLTVREAGPLRRGDPVEGVGRVAEASDAIFALPPDGVSSPVRVPEGFVIFRLVGIEPARLLPLDEARQDVLRAVRRQKALDEAKGRAEKLAEAVRKGEDPRALARQGNVTYGEVGPFSRAEPLGDRALGQVLSPVALTLGEGGIGGPVEGPGGFYVVKLLGTRAAGSGRLRAGAGRARGAASAREAGAALAGVARRGPRGREDRGQPRAPLRQLGPGLRRCGSAAPTPTSSRSSGSPTWRPPMRAASRTSCPCAWSWSGAGSTSRPGRPGGSSRISGRTPQIAVSADDYTEAWKRLRGVVVQGTATVHARNPTFRRIRRRLYAKYPQYAREATLGDRDSVVVEITPRRVYAWGFD